MNGLFMNFLAQEYINFIQHLYTTEISIKTIDVCMGVTRYLHPDKNLLFVEVEDKIFIVKFYGGHITECTLSSGKSLEQIASFYKIVGRADDNTTHNFD
jgi:hypothetical protein